MAGLGARWDAAQIDKLRELCESGEVTPADKPLDIKNRYPCFEAFTADQFRNKLTYIRNKMKKDKDTGSKFIYIICFVLSS
jgi:hypothetical protein